MNAGKTLVIRSIGGERNRVMAIGVATLVVFGCVSTALFRWRSDDDQIRTDRYQSLNTTDAPAVDMSASGVERVRQKPNDRSEDSHISAPIHPTDPQEASTTIAPVLGNIKRPGTTDSGVTAAGSSPETVGVAVSQGRNGFQSPTDAELIEGFTAESRFGPGNRGYHYDTSVGDRIVASAQGRVAFSGHVGGSLFVTTTVGDLKVTYGYLHETDLKRHDLVEVGDLVGLAATDFHFTIRDKTGAYIDPAYYIE